MLPGEMEGEMRSALVILTIVAALLLARSPAWAVFNCFEAADGERKCACIGADDCREMRQSGNCKSDTKCDHGELGVMICNCQAFRTPSRRS